MLVRILLLIIIVCIMTPIIYMLIKKLYKTCECEFNKECSEEEQLETIKKQKKDLFQRLKDEEKEVAKKVNKINKVKRNLENE